MIQKMQWRGHGKIKFEGDCSNFDEDFDEERIAMLQAEWSVEKGRVERKLE